MSAFDPRILALRGTDQQIDAAAKAFSVIYRKVPLEDGDYTMDHSAGVRLVRADGTLQGTLDLHEPRDIQLKKLIMLAHSAKSHFSRIYATPNLNEAEAL